MLVILTLSFGLFVVVAFDKFGQMIFEVDLLKFIQCVFITA